MAPQPSEAARAPWRRSERRRWHERRPHHSGHHIARCVVPALPPRMRAVGSGHTHCAKIRAGAFEDANEVLNLALTRSPLRRCKC